LNDLKRQWSRWLNLPAADKRTLAVFVLSLPLVDIALRTIGLKRTQRWLQLWNRRAQPRPCLEADTRTAQNMARLAAIAGAHGIYPITCLRQALLVQSRLRREGLPALLRIGTRKDMNGLVDAHAWVELDGVALGQSSLDYLLFSMPDSLAH